MGAAARINSATERRPSIRSATRASDGAGIRNRALSDTRNTSPEGNRARRRCGLNDTTEPNDQASMEPSTAARKRVSVASIIVGGEGNGEGLDGDRRRLRQMQR